MEKAVGFKWGKSIEDYTKAMTRGHGYGGEKFWDEEEKWLRERFAGKGLRSSLSIGCGMFREMESMRAISSACVIGLDYEQIFVDYLNQNLPVYKSPSVRVIQGDARQMLLEDNEVDLSIITFGSIGIIPNHDLVVKEMDRVTSNHGSMIISLWKDDDETSIYRAKTYINNKDRNYKIEMNDDTGLGNIIIYQDGKEFYRSGIVSKWYMEKLVKDNLPSAQIEIVDLELCRILEITKT